MKSVQDDCSEQKIGTLVQSTKKRLILVGVTLVALFLGATGTLIYQVVAVRAHLEGALASASELRSAVLDDKTHETGLLYKQLEEQTSSAKELATGPIWRAGSWIPFLGPSLDAVTEVAISADDLTKRVVLPLLNVYESTDFNELTPTDGRVNIGPIEQAADDITSAASAASNTHARLKSISLSNVLTVVAEPVLDVTNQFEEISDVLAVVSDVSRLLPSMLGGESPRTYLVLVQNNAEVRATGGLPGALAVITASDGEIALDGQSSANALGAFTPPLEVDPQQELIYTMRLGTYMQNVNLTPDFPTAASTAKRMWEERTGQVVDGVLALDPVVLSYLLDATGPVQLKDPVLMDLIEGSELPSDLTTDNVVPTLLSTVYRDIEDPMTQDAYFAAVAGGVFESFSSGSVDASDFVAALRSSVRENRVFAWSSHEEEQAIIAAHSVAGNVSSPHEARNFGVYFNDGTGAKMDYYVSRRVGLTEKCGDDGYSTVSATVSVTNSVPLDAAISLPAYVTGDGIFGVEAGHIRTNYVFYGPALSNITGATVKGEPVPFGSGMHGQRPVATVTVELAPGETASVQVSFGGVLTSLDPEIRVTPGLERGSDETPTYDRDAECR